VSCEQSECNPIWKGTRYELRIANGAPSDLLQWDFEFLDCAEDAVVAYIRKNSDQRYEAHLTLHNSDPIDFDSIPQLCSEIPNILQAYLGSRG
jgi:hypothetical protein